MQSIVSGVAGSVRLVQLTRAGITRAEKHGKRLDATGRARAINDVPALTQTGLDLNALYKDHVKDTFVPAAKTKALHMIFQFPKELVDPADAAGMLHHARAYAERVFGPDAVFADRIDRDEKNTQVVDLFIAPKYVKRTKRMADRNAISMTRALKLLAVKHGHPPIPPGIGRALQDELFEYFRDIMKLDGVERGAKKAYPGPDWKSAEQQRLEELEDEGREFERQFVRLEAKKTKVASEQKALDEERAELAGLRIEAAAAVAAGEAEKVRLIQEGNDHLAAMKVSAETYLAERMKDGQEFQTAAQAALQAARAKDHEAQQRHDDATAMWQAAAEKQSHLDDAIANSAAEQRLVQADRASVDIELAQADLLRRALDDDAGLQLTIANDGQPTMDEAAMDDTERSAYRAIWSERMRAFARFIADTLRQVREKLMAASKRDRDTLLYAETKNRELQQREESLQKELKTASAARLEIDLAKAVANAFITAWEGISEAERSPKIVGVLEQARQLLALKNKAGPPLTGSTPPPLKSGGEATAKPQSTAQDSDAEMLRLHLLAQAQRDRLSR